MTYARPCEKDGRTGRGRAPAPTPTTARHREIAGRLSRADGLLVGLDFDGTLAPIADDPDVPTITPACRRALGRLAAAPHTAVAVISGRELSDLRARVGLEGVVYAGNHGLELRCGETTLTHPAARRLRPALRRSIDRLSTVLAGVPGCEIEDKGLTATVHVRRTPPGRVDEVRSAVEASVREAGEALRVSSGKEVFEIRPAIEWDKGAAIRHLAGRVPEGWTTVYVGDDVTDEDAFRAIRPEGIGVLVGSREGTDAAYRLPDQGAVAPFLDRLAEGAPP